MLTPYQYYRQQSLQHDRTVNGVTTSTVSESPYANSYYFNVIGFGRGDPSNRIVPTPGEYYIHNQQGPRGLLTRDEYYYGTHYARDQWNGYLGNQYGAYFSNDPIAFDNTVYNGALSELYENIKDTQANLALSLGEARETARTLQFGKSIYEVLLTARKAKRALLLNPSKTMSEIWLGYKYGWSPLFADIYGYLNWFYQLLGEEGLPIRERNRKTVRHNHELVYQSGNLRAYSTGMTRYMAEVKVWVRTSDSTLETLSRLTSLNPASIAWELFPLSFVIDWFYDVGGYLQNMEAAFGAGLQFERGYTTELVYNTETSFHIVEGQSGFWPTLLVDDGSYEASRKVVWKRRTKLNTFPFPRAPVFSAKLGAQRMISAAALLRTILLGGVKGRRV
jgi:hypothetical protein